MWRMWRAIAVVDLGLSLESFGALTPAEFFIIYDRFRARKKHSDWQMALLTSSVINAGFARPKKMVTPEDLMPKEEKTARERRALRPGRKRQMQIAQGIAEFFGGSWGPSAGKKRS